MTLRNDGIVFQFCVDTAVYQSLELERRWRWAGQERIAAPVAYQYLGEGEHTMSLPGVIYPHYRGGLGQTDKLAAAAESGATYTLTTGRGAVLGLWFIESLTETHTEFERDGTAKKIEFTLTLKRFGDTK